MVPSSVLSYRRRAPIAAIMGSVVDEATRDVLEEFALTSDTIQHSDAQDFFAGLPRFSLAMPQYGALTQYAIDLATSAGIAVVALFAVMLLLFILLIVRLSCCAKERLDRKQFIRREKDPKANLKHLIFSTILIHLFLIFLGVGISGAIILAESALDIWSSIDALVTDLRRTGLSLMDFMIWVKSKFETFDAEGLNDGTEAGEFLAQSFGTLKDYIPPRFPDVQALRIITKKLLDNILGIISMLAHNVRWMFTAMMAITLVSFLAAAILYATGMFSKKRTCCTVLLQVIYLSVPLLFTWVFFAVWTGAGIGVADGCRMASEYREFLKTGVQVNTTANVLLDTNLICPSREEADKLVAEMEAASGAILDNPLATDTMTILLGNIANEDLDASASWATDQAIQFINCSILLKFSGRLESLACGDRPTSVISGIRYLWWSALISSITITTLFIASLFGSPVMWTASVWAPPRMEESCFGGQGLVFSDDHESHDKVTDMQELHPFENEETVIESSAKGHALKGEVEAVAPDE